MTWTGEQHARGLGRVRGQTSPVQHFDLRRVLLSGFPPSCLNRSFTTYGATDPPTMTSVPRQSLYPGMASTSSHYGDDASSSTHLASLQSALSSLSQTVQIFSHTNSLLAASVADVPRLSTALTSKRHFDVVTEGTVLDAKRQMEDEIRPLLKELIARGEDGVAREEANARRARNKVRIL